MPLFKYKYSTTVPLSFSIVISKVLKIQSESIVRQLPIYVIRLNQIESNDICKNGYL